MISQQVLALFDSPEVLYQHMAQSSALSTPEIETRMVELARDGKWLYYYSYCVVNRRIPLFEERLLEVDCTGQWLYYYALDVAKTRIPKFEERLAALRSSEWPLHYALQVAQCRVPLLEPAILSCDYDMLITRYLRWCVCHRIPEFERQSCCEGVKV